MRWIFTWFGLILWVLAFLPIDTIAQRNQMKCPPKAKAWKGKERRIFYKSPEADREEKKQARIKQERVRTQKTPVVAREKDEKENYYVKSRQPKVRIWRMASKSPSTDCPD